MSRIVNRVLVFLIGAVLLSGGVLVVIEAVSTWSNSGFVWIPGRSWLRSFETTAWSTSIAIAISAAVGGAGLILFIAEAKPKRKRLLEYRSAADGSAAVLLLRRPAEAHLARRVALQVPVSPVKARVAPRSGAWNVSISAEAASTSRPLLESAVQGELDALGAPGKRRLRIRTRGAADVDRDGRSLKGVNPTG